MYIIWGIKRYGAIKVPLPVGEDPASAPAAPASAVVVTPFGHLYFLPLFPVGASMLILPPVHPDASGYSVGISLRSILVTYLRSWPLVIAAALFIIAIINVIDSPPDYGHAMRYGVYGLAFACLTGFSYTLPFLARFPAHTCARLLRRLPSQERRQGTPQRPMIVG